MTARPPRSHQPLPGVQTVIVLAVVFLHAASAPAASSGPIDVTALRRPWPKQWAKTFEIGRHEVQWRQHLSRAEGILAGAVFVVPRDQQTVWTLANDYSDVGEMTPGVSAVRFLERQPNRQVIQVDIKVLWRTFQLTFEVEQDPPRELRFRLVNDAIGSYQGVCVFESLPAAGGQAPASTRVELATQLKPARPAPLRLLLLVERGTMLSGVRSFLEDCERARPPSISGLDKR